ncbi:trehalose operon repressor TreR [Necropsobacter massiliensis]|uniref:trehalose operon repressor TreR n=1 Tax=Necropsobacter massiliensis TaxID=1400001 RepID=UPI00059621FE|nr:trehalose operon repressor TreR [Necropsobacter massiliensis]
MAKLTIKDIARLCGVGKSTVSRVLNHDPNVSAQTRQRVEQIIRQYQFHPSKSARSMRGVNSRTIGIIVSRLSSASENQALAAMLPLLYANQCEPIIVESRFNPAMVQEHLNFFTQRAVDGVILFAFSELNEDSLTGWKEKMVVIARHYPTLSSVYYDDEKAIGLLMQHLYAQGHRHIAYLGVQDCDLTTGYRRHQSYQQFCQTHQLTPHSVQGELGYLWAYQHTGAVISPQISALVCATDSQALGAIKYLQENRLQQIQVCSVGNNPLLQFLFPNILMAELGFTQAGEIAVTQLLALLEGKPIQHYCVDCTLAE